jgi:hypothetical protein
MQSLIQQFNDKSNISITLDSISFKNIEDKRTELVNAKKQIVQLEKILARIYEEYALSLEPK